MEESLDLKAVWLQETGNWAVINGKVVGEGDVILDFRVEKILADRVLVQGAGGRKSVGFKPTASPQKQPANNDVNRTGMLAPQPSLSVPSSLESPTQAAGGLPQKLGRL